MDRCYYDDGSPQRCLPPFINAAFNRTVDATNTCGEPAEQYCLQTGVTGVTKSCHWCINSQESRAHGVSYLTDLADEGEKETWWQSSTMLHDVQYPTMVNLTLNLTKAFDITYVRLKFHTSRPESFAIYKKKCHDCDWQPFQYYSGSCFSTFNIDNKEIVTVDDEQKALCTDDYSDISPLTGGNVAFSTLEGRPSAYDFDRSDVLQDWVQAVAIRITLNRINTFGDEVFKDPKVLKSYYYAITDLSIGARCACNGHASQCYLNYDSVLVCKCQHNTDGPDCDKCLPLYNDRPWRRGSRDEPGECHECECNGLADSCYFDAELYRTTGRGGHCVNCRDNTDGPNCAQCLPFHYRHPQTNRCTACNCNDIGSLDQQCDGNGQCRCKPGVGGTMCDQCLYGYYGLSGAGCKSCECNGIGTIEGSICDSETGQCECKLNVEGVNCDSCKLGTMNLQASNPYGCTSCFCYGQSSVCEPSDDYTVAYIYSNFDSDEERWHAEDYRGKQLEMIYSGNEVYVDAADTSYAYFIAPDKFLGEQRYSYNQMLSFTLRLTDDDAFDGSGDDDYINVYASRQDVILEGKAYLGTEYETFKAFLTITAQGNPSPSLETQPYSFRLHEAAGWQTTTGQMSALDFQKMLNGLTAIKIRSSYGKGLLGHLDNVQLTTAERAGAGPKADWVEVCSGNNLIGDHFDVCAPGYTRDPPNGGKYAPCVRCNCNGHSDICDPETGVCDCDHNTMGDHCELCQDGYYFSGNEYQRGTPQECKPCPCPQGSSCAVLDDGDVVCTSCPPGTAGTQCQFCMDGWFGEPRGRGPCQRCMCNGNIDDNAVGNCNRTTGECLKCIHNTRGFKCDECLEGYWGKPVTNNPEERCQLCECNMLGSIDIAMCDPSNGQCQCKPNVEGRSCDQCRSGFWNLKSGDGCEACNCHEMGSQTGECDQNTGQCECLPGVGGLRCNQCLPNYYGLSREGCTACDCNPDGSKHMQCDANGRCDCKEGVLGAKCDQCQENFYDLASGCIECGPCYGLVQDAVNTHRDTLKQLENMTSSISTQDINQGNEDFEAELEQLQNQIISMKNTAQGNLKHSEELQSKMDYVANQLTMLLEQLSGVESNVDSCSDTVTEADGINDSNQNNVDTIRNQLTLAESKLNQAQDALFKAKGIADNYNVKEENMTRLAQQAREIADEHEQASEEIVSTAQQALDNSKAAEEAIQDAIDLLENLLSTLEDLKESDNKLPAATALRDDLLSQSAVVKANAKAAKNEATDLYTQASKLALPDVDTENMETRAVNAQNEAESLMPEVENLNQQFDDNWTALEADIQIAETLLDNADATQDTIDRLLAQAHNALKVAEDAVAEGNETYSQLQATKASLQSFDEEINSNKEQADAALNKSDSIQQNIDEANAKTAAAKEALGQAAAIATSASEKAHQAEVTAGNVQNEAGAILEEANASQKRAEDISDKVDVLNTKLDDTDNLLQDIESKATADKNAVEDATTAASTARGNAMNSKNRVDAAIAQLNELLQKLESTADVSDDEIAAAEARFAALQQEIQDANVEALLTSLEEQNAKFQSTLQSYDVDLAQVEADVANLKDIDRALPETCANDLQVEQP